MWALMHDAGAVATATNVCWRQLPSSFCVARMRRGIWGCAAGPPPPLDHQYRPCAYCTHCLDHQYRPCAYCTHCLDGDGRSQTPPSGTVLFCSRWRNGPGFAVQSEGPAESGRRPRLPSRVDAIQRSGGSTHELLGRGGGARSSEFKTSSCGALPRRGIGALLATVLWQEPADECQNGGFGRSPLLVSNFPQHRTRVARSADPSRAPRRKVPALVPPTHPHGVTDRPGAVTNSPGFLLSMAPRNRVVLDNFLAVTNAPAPRVPMGYASGRRDRTPPHRPLSNPRVDGRRLERSTGAKLELPPCPTPPASPTTQAKYRCFLFCPMWSTSRSRRR